MKTQQILSLFIGVIILFMTAVASGGESWFVIKDKDDALKVVKVPERTANTVAGPFTSRERAAEALAKAYSKIGIEKLREKAAEGIERVKSEAEKLRGKASPGIEKAKIEADKLKEKAEQGVDMARDMIKDYLPKK
ncbi:MAG: hypothetical protein ACP5VS_12440 [Desulfomonilaceae bacterium]